MESLDLLRSIPMFATLSDDDLRALATAVSRREFRAGAMIFALGDRGNAMYIVERGDVNIHLPGQSSQRISLKDISRGEYFGELALFDEKPRSASAVATTDTHLLELKHDTLTRYLERRPAAAMAILRTMSERLRETNELLSARAAKNVDAEFDKNLSWSDRIADKVAELNGSWAFILFLITADGGLVCSSTPAGCREAGRSLPVPAVQPGPRGAGRSAGPIDRDEPEPPVTQGPRARRDRLQGQSQE
jgi:CRP/FNR family cyclic AMP-dependent transcriptional regulator